MTLEDKRLVVLGSSSIGEAGSGTLGKALRSMLPRTQLTFIGRSGYGFAGSSNSFTGTAAQRNALAKELQAVGPFDYVLVVLGSNPTGGTEDLQAAMRWFAGRVGQGRVFWVGPPVYATLAEQRITNLYDAVGPTVLGKRYVSSRGWTDPIQGRTADKVHFTVDGARNWAQGILTWVQNQISPSWAPLLALAAGIATLFYFLRR